MGGAERAGIRYQLEAKLLGPGGVAISIGSCTVKQYFDENGKINCELTWFKVLARRIKRRFPRLPICAVACGRLRWNIENSFKVEKADYGYGIAVWQTPPERRG